MIDLKVFFLIFLIFSFFQNPIPTNKPNVDPKRPPRPVNVTTNVKLSPTVANNINVSWCSEFSRIFVLSAYLVKKLSSDQLLHRLKTKGVKPADFTRGLSEFFRFFTFLLNLSPFGTSTIFIKHF